MKSTTKTRSKSTRRTPPPSRSITVLEQPTKDTDGWGAVRITVGSDVSDYLIHLIPSDLVKGGIGFEVEKLSSDLDTVEAYHVHLASNPADCYCTCKGNVFAGHCKHADGLTVLTARGALGIKSARDHRHDPEQPEEVRGDEVA